MAVTSGNANYTEHHNVQLSNQLFASICMYVSVFVSEQKNMKGK